MSCSDDRPTEDDNQTEGEPDDPGNWFVLGS